MSCKYDAVLLTHYVSFSFFSQIYVLPEDYDLSAAENSNGNGSGSGSGGGHHNGAEEEAEVEPMD